MNPLKFMSDYGQVIWLDFLSRRFIADGSLKRLIDEDGLAGVTSTGPKTSWRRSSGLASRSTRSLPRFSMTGSISSQMLWTSYWGRLLASAPPRITSVKLV